MNLSEEHAMKRNLHLLTLGFIASVLGYSGGARADDIRIDPSPFVPSAPRAEVRAELDVFKKPGISPWATHYDLLSDFKSSATRAQVIAEYIRERDAIASMTGEDSGSKFLSELRHKAASPVHLASDRSNGAPQ